MVEIVYIVYRGKLIKVPKTDLEEIIAVMEETNEVYEVYPQYRVFEWLYTSRRNASLHYKSGYRRAGNKGRSDHGGDMIFPGYVPIEVIQEAILIECEGMKPTGSMEGMDPDKRGTWRHNVFSSENDRYEVVIRERDPINNSHDKHEASNYEKMVVENGALCDAEYPYVGIMIERMGIDTAREGE